MFRERYWDETEQEYEAKQLNDAEMRYEIYRHEVYEIGWLAGVPNYILNKVQENLV
tara:strand:+ start:179 stop:346 length:168 start_codon:yes stop_codon:yes gene_type:complete